ncbi:SAV_2336 N-terminal domain-related protein [Streptomyces sp. MMS24-I31]|uniref:SAV_2336 N-terminal domain-related protein n=1 Tax=Streptomyces sp. MMS24-I31 TaxID=3351563 RepID=UPI003896EE81
MRSRTSRRPRPRPACRTGRGSAQVTAPDARTWLITAAPAPTVPPAWRQGSRGLGLHEPVFAEAPAGWPGPLPTPAAETSAAALHALIRLQPDAAGSAEQTADAYTVPDRLPRPQSSFAGAAALWELVLVVDTGVSMAAWYPTVNAFAACVRDLPLFSETRIVKLRTHRSATPDGLFDRDLLNAIRLGESTFGRRKMVLILTDGVGAAWKRRLLWPDLRCWAGCHTVAILNVLPHYNWHLSGLHTRSLRLRTQHPGCANRALLAEPSDTPSLPGEPGPEQSASLYIPVLEIRKRWLDQWARLLMSQRLPVRQQVLEIPEDDAGQARATERAASGELDADPDRRIATFRTAASDNSFALAVLLAAAPLNRHVMQLIAVELLPEADAGDLAAILTSGLITTVDGVPEHHDPFDAVTFDFLPGVRQRLLSLGETRRTRKVAQLLDTFLGPHVPAMRGIAQRMRSPDPTGTPRPTRDTHHYSRVELALLTALSGDSQSHREAAHALQAELDKPLP